MPKLIYLSHQEILQSINNYNGPVFLFGYSQTTRESLAKVHHNDVVIVDNNPKLHGMITPEGRAVCTPQELLEAKSALVVVWGNHCEANIAQLQELGVEDIYVDVDFGGYRVNPPKFILETPPSSHLAAASRTQHDFILKAMRELTLLEIPFETHPIADVNAPRSYKKIPHTITLSYHTHGEETPNLFRYKESYLPGYVTFDTRGFSGWHSLCQRDIEDVLAQIDTRKAEKFHKKIFKKYVKKNRSKYEQEKVLFDFPKKFLFFPLQLSHDVVASLAGFSQEEVLRALEAAFKNTTTKLLVKRHPLCRDEKLEKLLKEMSEDGTILLYQGSVHDAISRCEGVIVANSGVGFEALLHLKPVYSFATSEYMACTQQIESLDALSLIEPYKIDAIRVKKFLYYYLKRVCFKQSKQIRKLLITLLKNHLQAKDYV